MRARDDIVTAARLGAAVAQDELELHYQPILELPARGLSGLEALVRWRHPERGLLQAGDFIEVAEANAVIHAVAQWTLDAACGQLRRWAALGFEPRVGVNVSAVDVIRGDLVGWVAGALAHHGVPARQLVIEITETAAMRAGADPAETLGGLADLGVTVAIDDFGAGYSSLSRLRELPVSVLKIDRSFLREVPRHPEASAMCAALVRFLNTLGLSAIAEGVEDRAQLRFLMEEGCPFAQGFHLGRPAPAAEVAAARTPALPLAEATAA